MTLYCTNPKGFIGGFGLICKSVIFNHILYLHKIFHKHLSIRSYIYAAHENYSGIVAYDDGDQPDIVADLQV